MDTGLYNIYFDDRLKYKSIAKRYLARYLQQGYTQLCSLQITSIRVEPIQSDDKK